MLSYDIGKGPGQQDPLQPPSLSLVSQQQQQDELGRANGVGGVLNPGMAVVRAGDGCLQR